MTENVWKHGSMQITQHRHSYNSHDSRRRIPAWPVGELGSGWSSSRPPCGCFRTMRGGGVPPGWGRGAHLGRSGGRTCPRCSSHRPCPRSPLRTHTRPCRSRRPSRSRFQSRRSRLSPGRPGTGDQRSPHSILSSETEGQGWAGTTPHLHLRGFCPRRCLEILLVGPAARPELGQRVKGPGAGRREQDSGNRVQGSQARGKGKRQARDEDVVEQEGSSRNRVKKMQVILLGSPAPSWCATHSHATDRERPRRGKPWAFRSESLVV